MGLDQVKRALDSTSKGAIVLAAIMLMILSLMVPSSHHRERAAINHLHHTSVPNRAKKISSVTCRKRTLSVGERSMWRELFTFEEDTDRMVQAAKVRENCGEKGKNLKQKISDSPTGNRTPVSRACYHLSNDKRKS